MQNSKIIDFHIIPIDIGHHDFVYTYRIHLCNGKYLTFKNSFSSHGEALENAKSHYDLKYHEIDKCLFY